MRTTQTTSARRAQQLVTGARPALALVGPTATALLGRRMLPNEQIDFLHRPATWTTPRWPRPGPPHDASNPGPGARLRAGYNRFLADSGKASWPGGLQRPALGAADDGSRLCPPAGNHMAPPHRRAGRRHAGGQAAPHHRPPRRRAALNLADAADAMREAGLIDSPLVPRLGLRTRDPRPTAAAAAGQPPLPLDGGERFWQMHLTVPAARRHGAQYRSRRVGQRRLQQGRGLVSHRCPPASASRCTNWPGAW